MWAAIALANNTTSRTGSAGSHSTTTSPNIACAASHPTSTERRSNRSANTPVSGASSAGSIATRNSNETARPVPSSCCTWMISATLAIPSPTSDNARATSNALNGAVTCQLAFERIAWAHR